MKDKKSYAPKKSPRPKARPKDVSPKAEKGDQMHVGKGKGKAQGTKFSGTY